MTKIPLISIIVPTYNRLHFLKKTLISLINQTYPNIEILVINNYSKTNLKLFINKFKDSRIKLFNQSKKGTAQARNLGLKKATGQYICFCDDDDLYLSDKIKLQLKFMQKNPNLHFSYHNFYFQQNNHRYLGLPQYPPKTFNQLLIANYLVIHSGALMIKKKCFNTIKNFNIQLTSEDADFHYRLAHKFKFDYLKQPLTIYNLHHKNKKKIISKSHYLNIEKVKVKYLKMALAQIKKPSKLIQKKLIYHQGRLYLFQSKFSQARKQFFQFIKLKPISFWPYFFLITSLLKPKIFNQIILPKLPQFEFFWFKFKRLLPDQSKFHNP